eukprot:scaffold96549_cov60-Phaeocystis_antarctica.AAC.6
MLAAVSSAASSTASLTASLILLSRSRLPPRGPTATTARACTSLHSCGSSPPSNSSTAVASRIITWPSPQP